MVTILGIYNFSQIGCSWYTDSEGINSSTNRIIRSQAKEVADLLGMVYRGCFRSSFSLSLSLSSFLVLLLSHLFHFMAAAAGKGIFYSHLINHLWVAEESSVNTWSKDTIIHNIFQQQQSQVWKQCVTM